MAIIDPIGLALAYVIGRILGNRSRHFGWSALFWFLALALGVVATVLSRLVITQGNVESAALSVLASIIFIAIAAALGLWLPWPRREIGK